MELGFSGKTRVSSKKWEKIYLSKDFMWNVLLFGQKKKCDHVEWHSNREDTATTEKIRNS